MHVCLLHFRDSDASSFKCCPIRVRLLLQQINLPLQSKNLFGISIKSKIKNTQIKKTEKRKSTKRKGKENNLLLVRRENGNFCFRNVCCFCGELKGADRLRDVAVRWRAASNHWRLGESEKKKGEKIEYEIRGATEKKISRTKKQQREKPLNWSWTLLPPKNPSTTSSTSNSSTPTPPDSRSPLLLPPQTAWKPHCSEKAKTCWFGPFQPALLLSCLWVSLIRCRQDRQTKLSRESAKLCWMLGPESEEQKRKVKWKEKEKRRRREK